MEIEDKRHADNMNEIVCHIITLDSKSERCTMLANALNAQGIHYTFIEAIDGRNQKPALIDNESINTYKSVIHYGRSLSNTEIACYLSHYRLIKKLYDKGASVACIMEDDIIPEKNLKSVLHNILAIKTPFDLIRLMGLRDRKRKIYQHIGLEGHQLVLPCQGWCGAQGYVLSRQGMEKIIASGANIFLPIDILYDRFWRINLAVFGIEPHVIHETAHQTSVEKSGALAANANIKFFLIYKIMKLMKSIAMRLYLISHARKYFPSNMPEENSNNTAATH